MASNVSEHPVTVNRVKSKKKKGLSKGELRQLTHLGKRWKSHHEHDLDLRYQTGTSLNGIFGDPTQRQQRGKETIMQAAKELGLDVADISRLRRFAHRFESIEDLKRQHPEVTTWTAVRDLLRQPTQVGLAAEDPASRRTAEPVRKVVRALATFRSALRGIDTTSIGEVRPQLLEMFQELAEEVSHRLGIRLAVIPHDASQNAENLVSQPQVA